MLELRHGAADVMQLGFGGDVFNTAAYAARLGVEVSFVSATGDDHYSDWLAQQWRSQGVDCTYVRVFEGATPSLYIIDTNDAGERDFTYWRSASPFRALLDCGEYLDALPKALAQFDYLYYSGITLALFDDDAKSVWFGLLQRYRKNGGRVAFDPNYRPRLWASAAQARYWMDAAYQQTDIALPSWDDEQALGCAEDIAELVERLRQFGVEEFVIKRGELPCLVCNEGSDAAVGTKGVLSQVLVQAVSNPVDTTAAGDSFNAAYLHARIDQASALQAAAAGAQLAAKVVAHAGAIIPSEAML